MALTRRYEGRTVLVTGGGGGVGRALCHDFGREGAFVIAADLDAGTAETTIASLPDPTNGFAAQLDVADRVSWIDLRERVLSMRRTLDILCNNAGIMLTGPLESADLADWEKQARVNVAGVMLGCQTFLPSIRERGGSILNTASLAGLHPWPDAALYAASKNAVVGLSETLRLEVGSDVHICVLAPGGIDTAMTAQLGGNGDERLIPPSVVSKVALDAIAERRDWAFTHREYLNLLEARHAGIVADYKKVK